MDLIAIAQSIWRHKFVTFPIIALTMVLGFYVMVIKKPVYQATSSYILVAPPGPPSALQIQHDPALASVHSDNPYTRFGDLSIVVQLLTDRISTDAARQTLVQEGADSRYVAAPSVQVGATAPIVQITGDGASAAQAMHSASLVGQAIINELNTLQAAAGVDRTYWISTLQLQHPDQAQLQTSSKLRTLIAVFALAVVLMFMAISFVKALAERKAPRQMRDDAPLPHYGLKHHLRASGNGVMNGVTDSANDGLDEVRVETGAPRT